MFDYREAAKKYVGHVDPNVGRFVSYNIYEKYDAVNDCFYMYLVTSRGTSGKSSWNLELFATIYRDRIVCENITFTGGQEPLNMFHITRYDHKWGEYEGTTWRWTGGTKMLEFKGFGRATLWPVQQVITTESPTKVRTFDNDKRNALNREIQRVRRLVAIRHKLGAFDNITWAQLEAATPDLNNEVDSADVYKWIEAAHGEDLNLLLQLLAHSALGRVDWKYRYNQRNVPMGKQPWTEMFNKFTDSHREGMRLHVGAVYYI